MLIRGLDDEEVIIECAYLSFYLLFASLPHVARNITAVLELAKFKYI